MDQKNNNLKSGFVLHMVLIIGLFVSVITISLTIYLQVTYEKSSTLINYTINERNDIETIYQLYVNNQIDDENIYLINDEKLILYNNCYYKIYEKNGYILIEKEKINE